MSQQIITIMTINTKFILYVFFCSGIQDYEQGIVIAYGRFTRLHLFRAANHHEIVQNMVQAAQQHMNIQLKVVGSQITLNKFEQEKFGAYSYVVIAINSLIFIILRKQSF